MGKTIKYVVLTMGLLVISLCAKAVESRYEKYFVDKNKEQRWAIPDKTETVAGSQNFWFVTPHDVRKGKFNISVPQKKISNFNSKGFTFIPNSSWGEYTYRITPLKAPVILENKPPTWPAVSSRHITWNNIPEVKNLILDGSITDVQPKGKGFKANLSLKTGSLPVRFDVVKEKIKKGRRYPDVHSRQYGPHWRHTFDVYYPKGFKPGKDTPLPVMFYIHGGGWCAFNKVINDPIGWNKEGFVYISLSYRYLTDYNATPKVTVPVAAPLLDAARALQYVKYHAKELGLDPNRICLTGGSAGGASSSWLAMVDSLAEPTSKDPISRMSTRVACSIPKQAQTSLDPIQMRKWIPQINYGAGAFFGRDKYKDFNKLRTGEEHFQYFLDHRNDILNAIKDFSAYEQASKDDPPMLLCYSGQKDIIPATDGSNATHHPKFGENLHKHLQKLGVKSWYWCDNVKKYAGPYSKWQGDLQFLKDQLKLKK